MASNNPQLQLPSSPSPLVWFQLLDSATGQPYKGTSADKVAVSSTADVADFRDAVKAKFSNKLSSFDAADLVVYKNKAAFDKRNSAIDEGKEGPLEEDSLMEGLGTSKKEALVVVVPSTQGSLGQEPCFLFLNRTSFFWGDNFSLKVKLSKSQGWQEVTRPQCLKS